jgi:WD40 repeat protein
MISRHYFILLVHRTLTAVAYAVLCQAAGAPASKAKATADVPLAVDAFGDPLPPGPVKRLGSPWGLPGGPLRFLPDGKTLLAAGRSANAVYLRDGLTGRALRRFDLKGYLELFDFSPDGKMVVLIDRRRGGEAGFVLRDLASDREVGRLRLRPGEAPIGALFSPDGRAIVTSADKFVVWEAATSKRLYELPVREKCYSFGFSADGKILFTAYYQEGLVVEHWEVRSGKKVRSLALKDKAINQVNFSPDGQLLSLWKNQRGIATHIVVDALSCKELHSKTTHCGCTAFSPQGDLLARPGESGLEFVDARTGKVRSRLAGVSTHILFFSPDGKRIADVASPQTIGLWDVATGRNLRPRSKGCHVGGIKEIAIAPDGKTVYAVGGGSITVWDLDKRRLLSRPGNSLPTVGRWDFVTGGRLLASGMPDGTLLIWDPATGKEKERLAGKGLVIGLDLSPDGRTLALLRYREPQPRIGEVELQLWDRVRKRLSRPPLKLGMMIDPSWYHPEYSVAFSPDGKLVACNDRGQIYLLPSDTDRPPRIVKGRWDVPPRELHFSPDGKRLAAACHGHCLVWDVATGKEQLRLSFVGMPEPEFVEVIGGIAFSPDGRTLLTAHYGVTRFWELASGKKRYELEGSAMSLVLSRDQRWLIAGGFDGTIYIWDLKSLARSTRP